MGFDISSLAKEAFDAIQANDLERARLLLKENIENLPDDMIVYLGYINSDTGNFNDNFELFKDDHVFKYRKDEGQYYHVLALSYMGLDKMDDADVYFKKALKMAPKSVDVHFDYAGFLEAKGELLKASKELIKSSRIRNDAALCYIHLEDIFVKLKDYKKTIKYARIAIKKYPDRSCNRYNMGVAYANLKEYEKARLAYLDELKLEEPFPYAYFNAALIYKDRKEYDKGIYYNMACIKRLDDETNIKGSVDSATADLYAGCWYNMMCIYSLDKKFSDASDCLKILYNMGKDVDEAMAKDLELEEFLKSTEYLNAKEYAKKEVTNEETCEVNAN